MSTRTGDSTVTDAVARTGVPLAADLRAAADRLAAAGVPSPRHDAEALAAFVLGVTRGALAGAAPLDHAARRRFADLVDERARRVPLQHLTGRAPFRHLDLAVGPGVFVPRPETEVLVDWALDAVSDVDGPVCVDLCAGSGAIALALATERPGSRVHAVEREPEAYAWLERNAAETRAPVTLHRGDVTDPGLLAELTGEVDLVVSNPPYVPDGHVVEPEVAEHDPAAALWGGPDGLTVVRAVVATAARLLRPGGALAVEHADVQGRAVAALVHDTGAFADVGTHRDLAGRDRFVTGRRR